MMDKYGNYQTIRDLHAPDRVVSLEGTELRCILDKTDDLVYSRKDLEQELPLKDGVILHIILRAGGKRR